MSDSALSVLLGGQIAAELNRIAGGKLQLRYDDNYRAHPAATPLSASMPLSSTAYDDGVVTPWLWGFTA